MEWFVEGGRWETVDIVDITLHTPQSLRGKQVEGGEYYVLVVFSFIVSKANILSSNIAIGPFTDKIP